MAIGKTNSTSPGGVDTSDATAVASNIIKDKTAYVNGEKITGTIPAYTGVSAAHTTSNRNLFNGYYMPKNITVYAVTPSSTLIASNIKAGATVKIGDSADDDRVASITGTYTSDGTAAAGHILSGKIGYVNGSKITGTIATKTASDVSVSNNVMTVPAGYYASAVTKTLGTVLSTANTYNTSTSNQTIAAGQYLTAAQTIKAVTTSNISAGNIKYNVVVKVGDAGSATRIKNITGTFSASTTISSGQTAATAAVIRSGYSAFLDGAEVKGTLANGSATTPATTITANPTGSFDATTAKFTATVSKTQNVTPTVSAGYISSGTAGTITVSGSATITPSSKWTVQAAKTWTPTTTNQTIAANTYCAGAQTISGDANLVAANILSGKSIFGVAGTLDVGKNLWIGKYNTNTAAGRQITLTSSMLSTTYVGTLASSLAEYDSMLIFGYGFSHSSFVSQVDTYVAILQTPSYNSNHTVFWYSKDSMTSGQTYTNTQIVFSKGTATSFTFSTTISCTALSSGVHIPQTALIMLWHS